MSKYEWNASIIEQNVHDERKRKFLNELINHTTPEEVSFLFDDKKKFKDFKDQFRKSFIQLSRISEDMVDYIFSLYEKVSMNDIANMEFPTNDKTDEDLVESLLEFFENLNDPQILREVRDIINPNNHYLKIENSKFNKTLNGNVIKGDDGKSFGVFYMKGRDIDNPILVHEVGHMLSHRLFWNNLNPIMQQYLTEVESYYMELLYDWYIGMKKDKPTYSLAYRNYRLYKIMDQAWDIHIQALLNDWMLVPSYKEISKTILEEGYDKEITKDNIDSYTKIPLLYKSKMVNSYIVAIELFRLTVLDKEKGLDTYKKLFTSDIIEYERLLSKYKLNYLEDDSTLNMMINESKSLKKILTGD